MIDTLGVPIAIQIPMRRIACDVDAMFEDMLSDPADRRRQLYQAMRHASVGGGKRLRPLLVMASAALFRVPRGQALRTGLAAECIHVHSLIHDDLPCMDDDDLRRGRPTVHKAFDEATAVLAGDALHAMAFEILAHPETHGAAEVRAELVLTLARAAGADGMAGGQMLDLLPSGAEADLAEVTRLQRLKTGALIGWCVEAGGILGYAPADVRTALRGYAHCLGLAFQIVDDLLDHQGSEEKAGKRLRKDPEQAKATYVSLLGPERARRQAELLVAQAGEHLRFIGDDARLLNAIARFALERDR